MYNLISFVSRAKVRKQILLNLDSPKTPTELSKELKTHRPTISRALIALENKELVKCITPNENMGRYYQITSLGKKTMEKIK